MPTLRPALGWDTYFAGVVFVVASLATVVINCINSRLTDTHTIAALSVTMLITVVASVTTFDQLLRRKDLIWVIDHPTRKIHAWVRPWLHCWFIPSKVILNRFVPSHDDPGERIRQSTMVTSFSLDEIVSVSVESLAERGDRVDQAGLRWQLSHGGYAHMTYCFDFDAGQSACTFPDVSARQLAASLIRELNLHVAPLRLAPASAPAPSVVLTEASQPAATVPGDRTIAIADLIQRMERLENLMLQLTRQQPQSTMADVSLV